LRLGAQPRVLITTTPKPTRLLKTSIADPKTHVTRGRTADNVANLAPTFVPSIMARYEGSQRQFCKKCGGHLMTNHPPLGLVDVFAATLPTLKFSPGVHVNYAETVLPMRDGVPKLRGFPKAFGGSGERVSE